MENETHPVQRSLAPWTLKAESYLLFLKLKELPLSLYDRLEEAWEDENLGRFEGGLGAVMIVRYSETPVGGFFSLSPYTTFTTKITSLKSCAQSESQFQVHFTCLSLLNNASVLLLYYAWWSGGTPLQENCSSKRALTDLQSSKEFILLTPLAFFLFCVVKCLRMYL